MIIAVLTGQRPELLEQTLSTLDKNCPKLVSQSTTIILNNGGDDPTREVIKNYRFDMVYESSQVWTCGESVSFLGKQVQHFYAREEYLLFLEDDWVCDLHEKEWVYPCIKEISKKHVSQIRLRHRDEKVLDKHMVTGKPIRWFETQNGFLMTESAHLTFNPSFVKIRDLKRFLPANGEREAQKKWVENDMGAVMQHNPGVFRHIGDTNSLRLKTGSPV